MNIKFYTLYKHQGYDFSPKLVYACNEKFAVKAVELGLAQESEDSPDLEAFALFWEAEVSEYSNNITPHGMAQDQDILDS